MIPPCRFLLCLSLFGTIAASQAADRVALVVGNGAYVNGSTLENPANDATLLADSLRSAGFDVALVTDGSLEAMEKALVEFGRAAREAKAAWFFYAGHGLEVKGQNFLVPFDAVVEEEFQVRHKTLALDMVLGALDEAGTPLKVIVLDCCRDNPFGRSWKRSGAGGLGQVVNPPTGTIIAFAAAPGSTAEDGTGKNSPFTTALAEALALPGREIDQIFKETGRRVIEATEKRQQPWVNSSFYDSFVVRPGDAAPAVPMTVAEKAPTPPGAQAGAAGAALRPFELPLERGQRAAADEIEITPGVISVGKWPEGIAAIGNSLWVAESGQRSLGQFETATGELIQRVTCGRLPVSMATLGETLYATVNTDGKIWRQPAAGKGGVFAATGSDYPEALAAGDDALYALLWLDGSNADSVVARIDAATGKITRSASLGANAADLIVAGGNVWVINNFIENDVDNATLTRLDPSSLNVLGSLPVGGRQMKLAAAGDLIFVCGGWEDLGSVMSYDAATGEPVGFAEYTGTMVAAIGVSDKMVVSADSNGVVYLHHRDTLVPQRTIHLGIESFSPRDLVVTPDAIYLSVHLTDDEGVIYVINDWMPEGEVADPVVTRLLKAESLGGVKLGHSEAEMVKVLGEPEVRGEEMPNEYAGGFLIEAGYPAQGVLVMLGSMEKGGPYSVESVHLDETGKLASAGGIRIGHTLEDVRLVYGEYEDTEEFPVPDPIEKEFTFVAGSIYGGVIIQFADGKVSGIMLGAGAE